MNANKKNSGWILCPSKTFPGKFYYFNVFNGETAWGICDTEKKNIKRDGGTPKFMHPSSGFQNPEPSSPPTSDPIISNSVSSTQSQFHSMQHPTPIFGQSAFPKALISRPQEPNIIWTPIQIQVPILIFPESGIQTNYASQAFGNKMSVWGPSLEIGKEELVHTHTKPLCKRFVNFDQPVIKFDRENRIIAKNPFKCYTSTPIKSSSQKVIPTFDTITSNTDHIYQSKINFSFSDLKPKITEQNQLINEPVYNVEVPSNTSEKVLNLLSRNKDIEPKANINKVAVAIASSAQMGRHSHDLRNVLLAKKRKLSDFKVQLNTEETEGKKNKTINQDVAPKKVSFSLNHESINSAEYGDENDAFKGKYAATVQSLKELAGCDLTNEEWCIVADAEVLLEEFSFLDNFVQIDPNCKLVIPQQVMSEVAAVSKGVNRDRSLVMEARNIIRKLSRNHIIVQSINDNGSHSPKMDSILKSCIEAMNQNMHIILITNDLKLLTTAKCYPIHCYKIQDIKNGLAPKQKTDYKQLKITIRNDTKPIFTENEPAVCVQSDTEDLNYKEKDIRKTQTMFNSNVKNPMIRNFEMSNQNSRASSNNSKFSETCNSLHWNDCSRISKRNSIISDADSTFINARGNPKISNTNSIDHSRIDMTGCQRNSMTNENSAIYDTRALMTEWRCADSDITESTIEIEMKDLNLKEKPLEITTTLQTENKKFNDTKSFYSQPTTPKFNGRQPSIEEKQKPTEKSSKPIFEKNTQNKFETNEEPLNSVYDVAKEKSAHSKFKTDVIKTPQRFQSNGIENKNIDLSRFYVKSKIMENRLKDKMDEWVCTYRQIMEEALSSVLEKSPSFLKSMTPPWSLYESLKYTKTVYKEHNIITRIADVICKIMYDVDYKMDKIKKNIVPSEIMKAISYGMHLINYLKNIHQNSEDLTEAKERLLNMLTQFENPETDIEEPVKTSEKTEADFKELKQNFVKNRSEIIKYLKNHYPAWQEYEERDPEIKIFRTFGRDLNSFRLERNNNLKIKPVVETRDIEVPTVVGNVVTKGDGNVATKSVGKTTTKVVDETTIAEPLKRNKDMVFGVSTKNVANTRNNCNIVKETNSNVKNEANLKVTSKSIITHNDCEVSKYFDGKSKPKTKSIMDFIKSKDTEKFCLENQGIGKYEVKNNLKILGNILDAKITIPNDYKVPNNTTDKNDKIDNKKVDTGKYIENKDSKTEAIPKGALNKPTEIHKDNNENFNDSSKTVKPNVPKIVRKINIIEKYEKNAKIKNNIEKLDYKSDLILNNETHSSNKKTLKVYGHNDTTNYKFNDNKTNDLKSNDTNVNYKNNSDYELNSENANVNNNNQVNGNYNHLKNVNNRRDDTLNDNSLGNEMPRIYSVMESFTSEWSKYLEQIQRHIDGSLQKLRDGRPNEKTNKVFRLKTLKASFMITKIIEKLNEFIQKESCSSQDGVTKNQVSKNVDVILKCKEKAQLMQKGLNMILTLTNEDGSVAEINSSMSVNVS